MRVILILSWTLIGVLAVFYHGGPGQEQLLMDDIGRYLERADAHAANGDWFEAEADYEQVLRLLPAERKDDQKRIRLQRAKAQMQIAELPEAHLELTNLVDELRADEERDEKLFTEAQKALANSQYYMTWLMRLEGLPREEWEPEIEAARQTYRLLGEQSAAVGDRAEESQNKEDLESVIRLARMDLSELQGLSIPKQCQGCKSGQCKGKSGRKKGAGQEKKEKDARGASSGPPPDNTGS